MAVTEIIAQGMDFFFQASRIFSHLPVMITVFIGDRALLSCPHVPIEACVLILCELDLALS